MISYNNNYYNKIIQSNRLKITIKHIFVYQNIKNIN